MIVLILNTKKQVDEMWKHIDIVVDEEKKTSTWTYDHKILETYS